MAVDERRQRAAEPEDLSRFFLERANAAELLHMLFGKRGYVGVGKNFDQRNFEWRERKRAIEPVTPTVPLPGHTRVPI